MSSRLTTDSIKIKNLLDYIINKNLFRGILVARQLHNGLPVPELKDESMKTDQKEETKINVRRFLLCSSILFD